MNKPDALNIGYEIVDQSRDIVKLLAIGVKTDGSFLILDSGLTEEDVNQLYGDFRVWVGEQISMDMLR